MGPKSVNKSDFVSKHTNAHLSQLDSSLSGRNKDNCWNVWMILFENQNELF